MVTPYHPFVRINHLPALPTDKTVCAHTIYAKNLFCKYEDVAGLEHIKYAVSFQTADMVQCRIVQEMLE